MITVTLNGSIWFVDAMAQIIYEGIDKVKGIPFSFLNATDLNVVQRKIRFPSTMEV